MQRYHCTTNKQTNQGQHLSTAKSAVLKYPQHGVKRLKTVVPVWCANHSLKYNNSITGLSMDFILEWYKTFLTVGVAIVGAAALAWLRSTFVTKKAHDDVSKALESRLSAVEKTIEDLPNSEDLHELDKRLIEVSGKIDGLNPQLTDLKRLTDLLMENELREKRNGSN
jgi:hypothetical protein